MTSQSAIDDILASVSLDRLAARVGAEPAQVEQAAQYVLPALLGGLRANAEDPAGEASIARALGQHAGDLDADAVDEADGAKITHHIFGDNTDQVVAQLGGAGGDNALVKKLVPLLAPLVLSYLAKQIGGGAVQGSSTQGGGLGGMLSEVLQSSLGGTSRTSGTDAGSIVTDLLGGLLGRGRR